MATRLLNFHELFGQTIFILDYEISEPELVQRLIDSADSSDRLILDTSVQLYVAGQNFTMEAPSAFVTTGMAKFCSKLTGNVQSIGNERTRVTITVESRSSMRFAFYFAVIVSALNFLFTLYLGDSNLYFWLAVLLLLPLVITYLAGVKNAVVLDRYNRYLHPIFRK